MNTQSFPCTSCGACCKRLGKAIIPMLVPDDPTDPLHFPYTWDKSGRCENLQQNNRCGVYENRPLICRVDDMADILDPEIPKADFIRANIQACNQMMEEDGISEEFRIKL